MVATYSLSSSAALGQSSCWIYEIVYRAHQLALGQMEMGEIEAELDRLLKTDLPLVFAHIAKQRTKIAELQTEAKKQEKHINYLELQNCNIRKVMEYGQAKNQDSITAASLGLPDSTGRLKPWNEVLHHGKAEKTAGELTDKFELERLESRINATKFGT